jgi:hypothetical protein
MKTFFTLAMIIMSLGVVISSGVALDECARVTCDIKDAKFPDGTCAVVVGLVDDQKKNQQAGLFKKCSDSKKTRCDISFYDLNSADSAKQTFTRECIEPKVPTDTGR